MRFYTKEYYTLMMSLGVADMYQPVIDKDYSDEEIEELYQKALDNYIEEERADYDEPPEISFDDDDDPEYIEMLREELEEYENREPFDEEEAKEDFEDIYKENLDEPDEDLPEWVRESVDPRILAMYFMPEKTYNKLVEADAANEEKFDALDAAVDDAFEDMMEMIYEDLEELMETLIDLENAEVIAASVTEDEIELKLLGCDEDGEEVVVLLRFDEAEVLENEGLEVHTWIDEDGDAMCDCELLYSEMYFDEGMPEIHMMFDNNGLKYLTFRCSEAYAYRVAE